jgi:LuxR family maltose regulon positive regulatory protein
MLCVMTPSAVAATKVAPPQPPSRYLRRDRLIDGLESSVAAGCGVVLVSAPAGTGKSTLLTGWLEATGRAAGWVQIDAGDDDPARLWSHVAAALPLDGSVTDGVAAAIAGGPGAVADWLIGAAADHGDELVLVLDDYYLITNQEVHEVLQRVLDVRPTNLVVAISTRVDPPLRLSRLRVRGQLTEVRGSDLRFEVDEAGWLLNAEAAGVSVEAVEQIQARTEGWAAGLVLARLSVRDVGGVEDLVRSFRGDDQLVADYLTEEFLESLPEQDRTRLLDVSILERMSGPLVDAVTGSTDGGLWLRSLAASNQLVIALDRTGTWFRLHHLLRDLLRSELEIRTPERSAELHGAAARWYEDGGEHLDAVEHHLAADNTAEAADLISGHATELLNQGRLYTVNRYLEQLRGLVGEHPGLTIVHGWVTFMSGRFNEAAASLAAIRALDATGIDPGQIQGLGVMVHLADGNVTSALGIAEDDPGPTAEPGNPMARGSALVWGGRFEDAQTYLDQAKEMAASLPDHFVGAVTPIFEAIAAIESGRPRSAIELARSALAAADRHGLSAAGQLALAHSIVARTTSDGGEAVSSGLRGVELARRTPEKVMLLYALASAADVAFVYDHEDAEPLLAEAKAVAGRCVDTGIAGRYLGQVEARHGRADRPTTALVEEISERELAVLRYLPSQLSQREIASELFVSVNTVKTHCRAIYRKLGVDGRRAAVQAARDQRLL